MGRLSRRGGAAPEAATSARTSSGYFLGMAVGIKCVIESGSGHRVGSLKPIGVNP